MKPAQSWLVALVAGLVGGLLGGWLMRSPRAPVALATPISVPGAETQDAATKVAQAVVTIEVLQKEDMDNLAGGREAPADGNGSGVFIRPDGYLLTNAHVVERAARLRVRRYGAPSQKAEVIGIDAYTDLAVLKIEGGDYPYLEFRDPDQVPVGEWVMAVGNPYGLGPTVTMGVLSGRDRVLKGKREMVGMLQTDAAINPGNSGGPLTDLKGRIIGICTAIYPFAQGLGFAVDANTAQEVSRQLIEDGKVIRGYLGLKTTNINPATAKLMEYDGDFGLAISEVQPDAPVRGKVQKGDILLEFEGQELRNPETLRRKVHGLAPGTTVSLKIWRGKQVEEVKTQLGSPP